jgi:hypothetical protein
LVVQVDPKTGMVQDAARAALIVWKHYNGGPGETAAHAKARRARG